MRAKKFYWLEAVAAPGKGGGRCVGRGGRGEGASKLDPKLLDFRAGKRRLQVMGTE